MSEIDERRKLDLENLEKIVNVIDLWKKDNSKSILSAMGEICNLFGQLHHNHADVGNCYIRNKYGYIQWNRNKAINEDGIYFEKFDQLKMVLKANSPSISCKDRLHLETDLLNLKEKINYILGSEGNSLENSNGKFSAPITNLINFIRKYCTPFILQRMKKELDILKNTDFRLRGDRYYFARIFIIVGELSNNLVEDKVIEESLRRQKVLEAFKNLVRIRHTLIHCQDITNMKIYKTSLNKKRKNIQFNLANFVSANSNFDDFMRVNNVFKRASNFQKDTDLMLSILKNKVYVEESIISNTNHKTNLNTTPQARIHDVEALKKLVLKAANIFKNEQKSNELSIKNKLNKLNNKYKRLMLARKNGSSDTALPTALDLSNKDEIIRCNDLLRSNKAVKPQNPTNENGMTLQKKAAQIFEKINDEIKFFQTMECYEESELLKKKYVMEHIVTIIGEYARHLSANVELRNTIDAKITRIVLEANVSAKRSRNEGLAHNIGNILDTVLRQRLMNDILPAKSSFEALVSIYGDDQSTSPVLLLNNLGVSFRTLGYYDEAIKKFTQGLDISDQTETDINGEYFTSYSNLGDTYMVAGNFNKALVIFNDLLKILDKRDTRDMKDDATDRYIKLHIHTAHCLESINQGKESLEFCKKAALLTSKHRITLVIAHFRMGQQLKAQNLAEKLCLQPDLDLLERFQALYIRAMIYLNKSYGKNIARKIQQCIAEMEKVIADNIGLFKTRLENQYMIIYLQIIHVKVRVMMKARKGKGPLNSDSLDQLAEDAVAIIGDMPNDIGKIKFITDIHLTFTEAYSQIKMPDPNGSNMEKAKHYFDMAKKIINILPVLPVNTQRRYNWNARRLTKIYMEKAHWFNRKFQFEMAIKNFKLALKLDSGFTTNKIAILLGILSSRREIINLRWVEYSLSIKCIESKSLSYCTLFLICWCKNVCYAEIINHLRKSQASAETILKHLENHGEAFNCKEQSKETLIKVAEIIIAVCYHSLGTLTMDKAYFQSATTRYDRILRLSLSEYEQEIIINNRKLAAEMKMSECMLKYRILVPN